MAYRLEATERLSDGLRRIAREEIEQALKDMACPDEALHESIHDARKCFKKIRALLRLIREPLGEERYRHENRRYRDAGRDIAHVRDSRVHVETLDDLCKDYGEPGLPPACQQLRQQLLDAHEQVVESTIEAGTARRRVALALHEGLLDLKTWPDIRDDFEAIKPGLRKIYSGGRKRFRAAQRKPSTESLHEWRKAIKYIWYQLRIITVIWPDHLDGWSDSLHTLSSALGLEHDLALFQEEMQKVDLSAEDQQSLGQLIEARRRQARNDAWGLGLRLYAERPSSFVERMEVYWQAMRTTHNGLLSD